MGRLEVEKFSINDRVKWPGLKMKNELDRFGKVVEVYRSASSVEKPQGMVLIAVEFDDNPGVVERGFLQGGGLERVLVISPNLLPGGGS